MRFVRLAVVLTVLPIIACGAAQPAPRPLPPAEAAAAPPGPAAEADVAREPAAPAGDAAAAGATDAAVDASAEAAEASGSDPAPAEATAPTGLPRSCPGGEPPCVPPKPFVDRLCAGKYPSVALVMFEKTSPWTHAYLRMREVKAVNTLGGPTGAGSLLFAEEVVIVGRAGGGPGGMQVSGADGLIVLRWDGTCATLTAEEVETEYQPGFPPTPNITWNHLDPSLQQALLASQGVKAWRERYKLDCRGQRAGTETGACKRTRDSLARAVSDALHKGLALPDPERLP